MDEARRRCILTKGLDKKGSRNAAGPYADLTGKSMSEIRFQLPEKIVLIHSIRTDDPSGIEVYWHKRFGAKRMQGEW